MGPLGSQAAGWLAFFGSLFGGIGFVGRSQHPAEITREKQLTFCLAFPTRVSKMAQVFPFSPRKVNSKTCLPEVGLGNCPCRNPSLAPLILSSASSPGKASISVFQPERLFLH